MKFVVTWTVRAGGSAEDIEAALKRSLEVLAKWTPTTSPQAIVIRADGQGGFGIFETDDAAAVLRDVAIFGPFLEHNVYPVLDIEQGVGVFQSAIEFRASI